MPTPSFRSLPVALCVVALLAAASALLAQVPPPIPVGNHFKCYEIVSASPTLPTITVGLLDQFGTTTAQVLRPVQLCNPVRKNNSNVPHPNLHLVCYEIADNPDLGEKKVAVRNQFGVFTLKVHGSRRLCLPSSKIIVP